MRENTKQKYSEYGPFSRSVSLQVLRHFFLRFYVALLASYPRFALVRIFGKVLSVTHLKKNNSRSSRPEMFYKKDVLRNFTKFTGKHLCQSLFFNKVAGPRTCFFIGHLWWLLLQFIIIFIIHYFNGKD